jgi:hypothetical protein
MKYNLKHYLVLFQWIANQANLIHTYDLDDGSINSFRTFNAIHSALRLWDSALDHNGMSCFMATIPVDVRLYHGSNTDAPARGLKWFAFDIRHALMFTKSPDTKSFATNDESGNFSPAPQISLKEPSCAPKYTEFGWQHEYATSRALNVLYFDGLSAAKTTMGTLDMQEILLDRSRDAAPISDSERARKLCDLLNSKWSAEVDGFIRMEFGIEVILCQAQEKLSAVRIAKRRVPSSRWKSMFSTAGGLTEYFHTAFARDKDFGRSKAVVNFDTMVTPHFKSPSALSRLFDVPPEKIRDIQANLSDVVQVHLGTATTFSARRPQDWQAVTDLIVSHYSGMLQRLASIQTTETLSEELEAILSPFLEDHRGFPVFNISTCALQYFPITYYSSVAAEAVLYVSSVICKTFAHMADVKGDLATSHAILHELISRLDWNIWKKCRTCAPDEYCWTPVWPFGTVADRAKPSCRSEATVEFEDRYWR